MGKGRTRHVDTGLRAQPSSHGAGATPEKAGRLSHRCETENFHFFSDCAMFLHSLASKERAGKGVCVGQLSQLSCPTDPNFLIAYAGTIRLILQMTFREDKQLILKDPLPSQHPFSLQKDVQVRFKAKEKD